MLSYWQPVEQHAATSVEEQFECVSNHLVESAQQQQSLSLQQQQQRREQKQGGGVPASSSTAAAAPPPGAQAPQLKGDAQRSVVASWEEELRAELS